MTCVRAYRKFEGLYNFTLLTASTNAAESSLQSRLDVSGVSYENGFPELVLGNISVPLSNVSSIK